MADFRGYVTAAGQQFESLAKQMKYPVTIGFIEIGDGKLPDSESPITRTRLINPLKQFPAIVEQDDRNPGEWVATCYIPADDAINGAGYMIREIGCKLINQGNGILYAYRRVSDDWKPLDSSGEAKSFIYKLRFIPSNGELLTPTIDPSVVLVSKEELARVMKEHKESRDHPAGTKTENGMLRLATDDEAKAGENDTSATTPKGVALALAERHLKSGSPLPSKNIGPIWHDDYASWMVWQEFTANGAGYRGYASQLIGNLLLDTQPTPRAGYIKSGVQNLSRTTYAALRAWAQHNGLMVAPGVWTAGYIQCADNADGTTFRIYDVRGEFIRPWDDNRGVDVGRAFGSAQGDAMRNITAGFGEAAQSGFCTVFGEYLLPAKGAIRASIKTKVTSVTNGVAAEAVNFDFDASRVVPTAAENRPRSSALLAAIKF